MTTGIIDQAPVYPREIVKKALFYEASALILVHNHPGKNPKPLSPDIDLTTQIIGACKTINGQCIIMLLFVVMSIIALNQICYYEFYYKFSYLRNNSVSNFISYNKTTHICDAKVWDC